MSQTGFLDKARPKSEQEKWFMYFSYCGGKGGGGCVFPVGMAGVVLAYRVPKFIVYNRRILFRNEEFTGIRMYTDGGPESFCDHSLGEEVPFYMALAADPNLDIQSTAVDGVELIGALPYTIEFTTDRMPQPVETAWEAIIYVYLWWGSADYINRYNDTVEERNLQIIKHDYDIKI